MRIAPVLFFVGIVDFNEVEIAHGHYSRKRYSLSHIRMIFKSFVTKLFVNLDLFDCGNRSGCLIVFEQFVYRRDFLFDDFADFVPVFRDVVGDKSKRQDLRV